MVVFKGLEVRIEVGGTPLEEYNDDEATQDENTITRYVEAQSNQEFVIGFLVPKAFKFTSPSLVFEPFIDGNEVGGHLIGPEDVTESEGTYEEKKKGIDVKKNKQWCLKHFAFKDLVTRKFHKS